MHDTAEEKAKKGQKIKAMISRGWKIDGKVVKKPMVRL
jgi:molecular chaperone GrpE (heat shock protein)